MRERSAQTNESIQRIIKPQTLIVGLEMKLPFTAYYMSKSLKPKLWQELQDRMEEIPYIRKKTSNPSILRCFEPQIYHYVAGIEVMTIGDTPERMVGFTLPTQEYAMYP